MDDIKQELLNNNNCNTYLKNKKYNIEINNFSKEEQKLILLSKKYKFDN